MHRKHQDVEQGMGRHSKHSRLGPVIGIAACGLAVWAAGHLPTLGGHHETPDVAVVAASAGPAGEAAAKLKVPVPRTHTPAAKTGPSRTFTPAPARRPVASPRPAASTQQARPSLEAVGPAAAPAPEVDYRAELEKYRDRGDAADLHRAYLRCVQQVEHELYGEVAYGSLDEALEHCSATYPG